MLARLAIGLDKKPELIAHLRTTSAEDSESSETLPERAANTIRVAFVDCLTDRAGVNSLGPRRGGPEGKKVGIYKLANLCLKVLFSCRKTRNAEQASVLEFHERAVSMLTISRFSSTFTIYPHHWPLTPKRSESRISTTLVDFTSRTITSSALNWHCRQPMANATTIASNNAV